jgi:hypothetical protein
LGIGCGVSLSISWVRQCPPSWQRMLWTNGWLFLKVGNVTPRVTETTIKSLKM